MIGLLLYALIFVPLVFVIWNKHHDVFHPWMYLIPQCVFLNAALPAVVFMADPEQFDFYSGGGFLAIYQALAVFMTGCLLFGVARGASGPPRPWADLRWKRAMSPRVFAIGIGAVGFAAFAYGVLNVGGLFAAYGRGYGGGAVSSGYLRMAVFCGVIGAIVLYAAKARRGRLQLLDWGLIALCTFPTLFHGLLGARRGPTFLALVVLVGGYLYFSRKKIGFTMAIPGAMIVGMGLLFLVANRSAIHLGANIDDIDYRSPVTYLDRWNSNEYLYGSATVRYANENGSFYGGRELVHLIGRFIPHEWWPSAYESLSKSLGLNIDIRTNGGIPRDGILLVSGWEPSRGAAPGFIGDFWLEFGYFSFPVLFLVGYLYGRAWKVAANSAGGRLVYPLLMAFSIYLTMQGVDPWLYRILLFGGPILLLARMFSIEPLSPVRNPRRKGSYQAYRDPQHNMWPSGRASL